MARPRRCLRSNVVYHVWNRRTDKQCLFPEDDAYEDLVRVIRRANARYLARLHAYCFLHTHVHFALSAEDPADVLKWVRWVAATHAVRFRLKTETRGLGHVYQDRYKSKPVDDVVHYATLIRYIERNPLDCGIVSRAQDWRWSSLGDRLAGNYSLIQPGPYVLPADWSDIVNAPEIDMSEIPSLLGQVSSLKRKRVTYPRFE